MGRAMNGEPPPARIGLPNQAVAWRGTQLVLVRGLAFVRLLVLAALVGPDAFGLWAIALAAVNTLATVSELGLIPALVQQSTIDDRQRAVAWTVGLGRAALIAAGLALAAPWVAALFDQPRAAPWIALVAVRPLIEAMASIRVADLQRALAFRGLCTIHGAGAVVETSVALGLASEIWGIRVGRGTVSQIVEREKSLIFRCRMKF
ncbi:MAG: oligosaccharide flippase family protein, partial [Acidobacteriota bacterium]